MTKKRIQQLTDFFYSSDSAKDVPLRLSIVSGQFTGFDLNKQTFIDLLTILNHSEDLKADLMSFLQEVT